MVLAAGCGSPGLTAARQLQRRGFAVTIYTLAVAPYTTSNMSSAGFTPTAGLGRVRKSPQVSLLRSFKNNGLGLQVRRGCPAGQCPRSRMRLWCVVRVFVRPPLLMDASRVRQREAEEVFDLSERQDHRVRVSILQVLIQRLIFARHHWSFRSNGWPHRVRRPARLFLRSA